jgi:7,8-dihydroneopterin aldolase/epimerase/oxygenase
MDKVVLKRIELHGKIGVLEKEKRIAQRYWITIAIGIDLRQAGRSDELDKTIDYSQVFDMAKKLMEGSDCDLLESYAEGLAGRILETFERSEWVTVEALKPDAPIDGSFDAVGIEITRTRND